MITQRFSDSMIVGSKEWRAQRYAVLWATLNPGIGEWESSQDQIWDRIAEEETEQQISQEERRIASERE